MDNIFHRNEKGNLVFERIDFEIMIADIIDAVEPKKLKDLEWMIDKMIGAVQLCAWEYVNDCDDIEDEWEDIYYPA